MTEKEPTFEEERKAPSMHPKVKEVYEKLRKYANSQDRAKWIKRRHEAWRGAIENEQWDDREKKELQEQDMVPLVINKCNTGVRTASALATYKKPEAVFMPIGSGDLYVAELFKRAYDYNWAVNQGNLTSYDVVEESKLGGIGFFDAYWDSNKGIMGRIVIEDSDPTCLYWDVNSRKRDMSDTDIIKARLRSRKYIKENYDNIKEEDLNVKFSVGDTVDTKGVTSGDNYKEFEGDETAGAKQSKMMEEEVPSIWEIQALMLVTAKERWVVTFDEDGDPTAVPAEDDWEETEEKDESGRKLLIGPDGQQGIEWERTYEKRVYRLIVGKKLISEEDNPYGLDSDRDPVINIVPVRSQRTLTSYPMSPTHYALPVNKEKNKRRAQFILHVSHNVNSPIVEPEGTKWRDRKGKETSPGSPGTTGTIPKSSQFMPQRLAPGAMEAQLFGNLEDRADRDIDDQYDTPPVIKGEVPQGMDPSGRAVLALQDMAGVNQTPFMTTFESGVANIAKVITYLSLKHWPRPMWRRLIEKKEWEDTTVVDANAGPGDEENMQEIDPQTGLPGPPQQPQGGKTVGDRWLEALDLIRPEDPTEEPGISLLDLDVKVLAGSSMPTNRIAKQQVALELKGAGVYDSEAVLDYTDDPAKDKILPRIRAMEKAAAVEAAMKEARKK